MRVPEIRKLIGQEIEWDTPPDTCRGYYDTKSGIVLEVKSRNVLIDNMGSFDWEWLSKMRNIRLKGKS